MRWKWWNIVSAMGWRQWFAKINIIVVESKWLELPSCIFWQSHLRSRFLFHHFCIQKETKTSYSCKMKAVWNPLRPLSNKTTHNQNNRSFYFKKMYTQTSGKMKRSILRKTFLQCFQLYIFQYLNIFQNCNYSFVRDQCCQLSFFRYFQGINVQLATLIT